MNSFSLMSTSHYAYPAERFPAPPSDDNNSIDGESSVAEEEDPPATEPSGSPSAEAPVDLEAMYAEAAKRRKGLQARIRQVRGTTATLHAEITVLQYRLTVEEEQIEVLLDLVRSVSGAEECARLFGPSKCLESSGTKAVENIGPSSLKRPRVDDEAENVAGPSHVRSQTSAPASKRVHLSLADPEAIPVSVIFPAYVHGTPIKINRRRRTSQSNTSNAPRGPSIFDGPAPAMARPAATTAAVAHPVAAPLVAAPLPAAVAPSDVPAAPVIAAAVPLAPVVAAPAVAPAAPVYPYLDQAAAHLLATRGRNKLRRQNAAFITQEGRLRTDDDERHADQNERAERQREYFARDFRDWFNGRAPTASEGPLFLSFETVLISGGSLPSAWRRKDLTWVPGHYSAHPIARTTPRAEPSEIGDSPLTSLQLAFLRDHPTSPAYWLLEYNERILREKDMVAAKVQNIHWPTTNERVSLSSSVVKYARNFLAGPSTPSAGPSTPSAGPSSSPSTTYPPLATRYDLAGCAEFRAMRNTLADYRLWFQGEPPFLYQVELWSKWDEIASRNSNWTRASGNPPQRYGFPLHLVGGAPEGALDTFMMPTQADFLRAIEAQEGDDSEMPVWLLEFVEHSRREGRISGEQRDARAAKFAAQENEFMRELRESMGWKVPVWHHSLEAIQAGEHLMDESQGDDTSLRQ